MLIIDFLRLKSSLIGLLSFVDTRSFEFIGTRHKHLGGSLTQTTGRYQDDVENEYEDIVQTIRKTF